MDLKKLGTLIHNKREEIGIPPSILAEKTGIRRPTLWIYERGENPKTGKPSRPSKDKLERLAEVLHMSQEETEELLSLADYTVAQQPRQSSSLIHHPLQTGVPQQVTLSPTITEINGTVYYAHDGYLEAFDARTGSCLWSSPTGVSPLDPALTVELPLLQNAIERIEEDIEDFRKHLPRIIQREIIKFEARLNKDQQGAHVYSTTKRNTPSYKAQKEPAMT
jgi:transcriptional regulator with XRE-family HTH domain